MPDAPARGHLTMISEHASPLAALGGADGGGQNVYVAEVARHLARRGWRVDVLTRRDGPDLPDAVDWRDGVRVHHVPAGPAEPVPKEALLPHMPAFARWTEAHCRRARPDLIHANFFLSGLVAAEVGAALDVPFAVTFHALGRVRRAHQGGADRFPPERCAIEERVARRAALVIAECPQDREDLVALCGADPARIREVPCGVDPAEFAPVPRDVARAVLGLPAEPFVALQLGRMVPRKGVDDALRAFARFRRGSDPDALLLVVGGAGARPDPAADPELARLTEIARDEGVADAVRFTGARDRDVLRYLYHAADAFLTLPWYEPFGITPLEAMACARPVIGTAVGGIKHSVEDGRTGLLVPPRDPDAAARALSRLRADPGLAARMGAAGRARVLERFTWDAVADGLEAAFGEVLAARRPRSPDVLPLPGAAATRVPRPPRAPAAVDPRGRAAPCAAGFDELADLLGRGRDELAPAAARIAAEVTHCLARGGKLLLCGNGGSAAEAQHMACELVGRFLLPDRAALPAIALGSDPAVTSAWANDVGFEDALARETLALGRPGDAILAFSTSGRSANLLRAFEVAGCIGLRRPRAARPRRGPAPAPHGRRRGRPVEQHAADPGGSRPAAARDLRHGGGRGRAGRPDPPAAGGCRVRGAVLLDKDGTLVEDVPYNVDPARIRLTPGAGAGLARLAAAGWPIAVVSNQSGVARGLFPEAALGPVRDRLGALLRPFGVTLAGFHWCPHHPDGDPFCICRKPAPGMLLRAAEALGADPAACWMIGDILDDVEAGRRAGCRTILIDNGGETEWRLGRERLPHALAPDLDAAARVVLAMAPEPRGERRAA